MVGKSNDFEDVIKETAHKCIRHIKDLSIRTEFDRLLLDIEDNSINELEMYERIIKLLKQIQEIEIIDYLPDTINFYENILKKPVLETQSFYDKEEDKFVNQVCYKFDLTNNDKMIIEHPNSIPYYHSKKLAAKIIDKYYHTKNKLVYPFIISKNTMISGRIIQQIEGKTNYFLVSCIKKRTKDDEYITTTFLGDPIAKLQADNFVESYYTYKFITSNETEDGYNTYILISNKSLPIDEVTITGMAIPIIDNIKIGSNASVPKGTELIYVIDYIRTIKEITKDEFKTHIENYKTFNELYEDYFSDFHQPEYFEKLLMAVIFASKGTQDYPSHLGLIGPAGCGKSKLLECIASWSKEIKVSSASTLKGLTPNFGGNTADPGEYIRCKRWFLLDEFFRIITKSEKGLGDFGDLNALLVHDTSRAVSGKHNEGIIAKPTATMIFVTNFAPGRIKDFTDMCYKIDNPFLSRCILYNYPESHVEFIKNREGELLKKIRATEKTSKFKGIKSVFPRPTPKLIEQVDYLKSINVDIDHLKIKQIVSNVREITPLDANIREVYDGRSQKHVEALIDGVTKINYILEHRDGEFIALDKDYKEAEELWYYVIGSWLGNIAKLPLEHRIKLLNTRQYQVYAFIKDNPGCMEKDILIELKIPVGTLLNQLIDYNIIKELPMGGSRGFFLTNYIREEQVWMWGKEKNGLKTILKVK